MIKRIQYASTNNGYKRNVRRHYEKANAFHRTIIQYWC